MVLGLLTQCKKEPLQFRMVISSTTGMWQETELPVMPSEHQGIGIIKLDTDATEQLVDGFGACFNELGWDALNMLPDSIQQKVLKDFFTPEGFNFTICRVPMGANDYARDWYSLNDTPGDFAMENFSIDRDRNNLIPYIKMAMEYNPDLKVWGSPWCPPAWMKTNNHYACRPDLVNDLLESGAGQEGTTQFIMKPEYLSAYSLYFSKFVKSYRNEGINLYAVHVQNEPNSCQNFPSCVWTAEDQATFIGDYLGPTFNEENLQAEIWYGTYERPWIEKIDTLLEDADASRYIAGIGFQWAGKEAIPDVNIKYPDMKLMQTESECGDGSNDWEAAEYTWSLIKHYFENGVNSYLYWNMILDETGKSQWGWKQNSLISVDSESGRYRFNPEYYLFKHLTHFVKPGAIKLRTPEGYEQALFFLNPYDELCGILVNDTFDMKSVQVEIQGKFLVIQLQPRSFNSFSVVL
jgi:glucosylceramidase